MADAKDRCQSRFEFTIWASAGVSFSASMKNQQADE